MDVKAEFSQNYNRTTIFSKTTCIRFKKVKTVNLNLNEARDDGVLGMQWHQLDHMKTIRISLYTDDHTYTSSLNFTGPMPFLTLNLVKALKAITLIK